MLTFWRKLSQLESGLKLSTACMGSLTLCEGGRQKILPTHLGKVMVLHIHHYGSVCVCVFGGWLNWPNLDQLRVWGGGAAHLWCVG